MGVWIPSNTESLSGVEKTWKSRNSKRGATEGEANAKPDERCFAWKKASKSRASFVAASLLASKKVANGMGAVSSRRGNVAERREKPLNENEPGTW
jgi:hypothetical protein